MISVIVCLIGLGYLLKWGYEILLLLRIHFVQLNKEWANKFGQEPWAIVTGCTGGIGKEFCFTLSELGFNILMVARNQKAMTQLQEQIESKYHNQCKCFQLDFESAGYEEYQKVKRVVQGLNLKMLINNVGFPSLNPFQEQTSTEIRYQIKVNIEAATYLTSAVLPYLLNNKRVSEQSTPKSAIINLSSMSIQLPFSSTPIYVATKSYNDSFSKSLLAEVESKGVDVLSVRAGMVSTPAMKYLKQIASITPKQCVSGILKSLGRVSVTHGHLLHNLQSVIVDILGYRICKILIERQAHKVREYLRKSE